MSSLERADLRPPSASPRRPLAERVPAALSARARVAARAPSRRSLLVAADALAAFAATAYLAAGTAFGWAAVLLLPAWPLVAHVQRLYAHDRFALRALTVDEIPAVALWSLSASAVVGVGLALATGSAPLPGEVVAPAAVAFVSGVTLRAVARRLWRRLAPPERLLVVGGAGVATAIRRKAELFPEIHGEVVAERAADDGLGGDTLAAVDRVVAAGDLDAARLAALAAACRRARVVLHVVLPEGDPFSSPVQVEQLGDLRVVASAPTAPTRSALVVKRAVDVLLGGLLLALISPLLALIALAVRLDSPGPAFFRQLRAGKDGRPFSMLKFRTMTADAPERLAELIVLDELPTPVFKLPGDPRVTRLGRLLRRTSLDELPQLVNVVRGEMSLVGPRPEQLELVERYGPEHRVRLAVRPGITGPMQVYGRASLTLDERLALERDYVENLSLRRDLRLLALTPVAVLGGRGAF